MATTVENLISTSVSDAKSTLECMLSNNPERAKELAEQVIEKLWTPKPCNGVRNGNMTRVAMLRTIIRRANKLLATSK